MDKTKNKQFDKLMERSQEQTQRSKFAESLVTLAEAAKLLESEREASAESWAWIYDGQRYALYELGRFDEAMDVCRKAIEHLEKTTQWAYLAEHSHVRGTLRATHNMLAWILAERAQSYEDCKVAQDHIERCLKAVSPIDPTNLQEFDETHAMVLLKLCEFADDPAPYKTQLHVVLLKMFRQDSHDLANNEKLQAIIKTDEFQEFMAEDPQSKLTKPPENETVKEAFARYQNALEFAAQINEDLAEWFAVEEDSSPFPMNKLEEFEKENGMPYPPALKKFAAEYGPFSAGSEHSVSIMHYWDKEKNPSSGLVKYIDGAWGGRPEFEEFCKAEHIEYLNKNYVVFGMRYIDDNCHEYAYFDREGNFGTIFFDQDGFEYFQRELNPMLKKSTASLTFDQVVSRLITGQIEGLIEQLNNA